MKVLSYLRLGFWWGHDATAGRVGPSPGSAAPSSSSAHLGLSLPRSPHGEGQRRDRVLQSPTCLRDLQAGFSERAGGRSRCLFGLEASVKAQLEGYHNVRFFLNRTALGLSFWMGDGPFPCL